MLTPEPSDSGQQVTLQASGILRFLPAAFLSVWLAGWAVGEWFALRMLATLLHAWLGENPVSSWLPDIGGRVPGGPAALFFLVFLLFWLALWTLGGVGAFQQVMALLFGCDVVRWGGDGLEVEPRALWFVGRERIEARAITGFRSFRGHLVADSRERAVRVTGLGSPDDRAQLCSLLEEWRATVAPPEPLPAEQSPVAKFVTFRDETGAIALLVPPRPRRSVGVWLGVLALALFGGMVSVFSQKSGAALVVAVLFLGVAGAACLAGSVWLLAARESWHMGPSRLERRRTLFGRTWSAEFVPLEIQLTSTRDSDGDLKWALEVSGAGRRQTIASAIDDPNVPLTLGTWLAERTGARFVRRDLEPALRRAG